MQGNRSYGDLFFKPVLATMALTVIIILVSIAFELYSKSGASIQRFGLSFLWSSSWDVAKEEFGALPFIYGTLLTSAIALLIGLPVSLGVAILLSELMRGMARFTAVIGMFVELLASVPSVIYGLWGLFFLSPLVRTYVEVPLHKYLGFVPLFSSTPFGLDFFTAGILLSIMIIPTISSIAKGALEAVPAYQKEAMYALGATKWEVIAKAILPYAKSGIFAAAILGLARAVGETMAVTMVIGNQPSISASLFSGGYTLAAVIANQFTEATGSLYISSLIEIGLVLFLIALAINVSARAIILRVGYAKGMNMNV
ncbi:MAG: phosphate ABC transporter permease subunit PstC [Conexivisphaerales archaeon]